MGGPPLFFDQTEAQGAKEICFWDHPLPSLSQGLDDCPPPSPPYPKVWIRHCSLSAKVTSSYLYPAEGQVGGGHEDQSWFLSI